MPSASFTFARMVIIMLAPSFFGNVAPIDSAPVAPVARTSVSGDSTAATTDSMPAGFTDTTMLSGRSELTTPMQMVFLPDGRALILERTGTVFIADPTAPGFPMEVYMKVENASDADETGLLSIAIDPDWSQSPEQQHIYLFWTRERSSPALPEGGYISRFTHVESVGGLASSARFESEVVIWHDTDRFAAGYHWHYGGQLSWGPDGRIYLSLGDKYSEQFQRSPRHHAGCILRLNKDGSIPAGNLPAHVKPPACWSHGLRNGFRSTWDLQPAGSERMVVAETGGNDNDVSSEDIHIAAAGKNFGWPFCEGRCDNPDFPQCSCDVHDDPIHTYPHNGNGAALIGGVVYRGSQFPAEWNGAYFYADFVNFWIKALIFTEDGGEQVQEVKTFHPTAREVISMAEDPDGNLWYTAFVLSSQGEIHRISYADQRSNLPPRIGSTTATSDGMDVHFSSHVEDHENDELVLEWHFGDGTVLAAPVVLGTVGSPAVSSPTHTYELPGNYVATLVVTDTAGNTAQSGSIAVTVGTLPDPVILHPANGQQFKAGEELALIGSTTDANKTTTFTWSFGFVHEDHIHPMGDDLDGHFQKYTTPSRGHAFEGKTGIRITLTAVTNDGLSASTSAFVWPEKVTKVFSTSPSGLKITLDGSVRQTPFVLETLVGFVHRVEFPPQCAGSTHYAASSWNGPHDISAGAAVEVEASEAAETFVVDYAADSTVCAPALPDAGLVLRLDAAIGVTVDGTTKAVSAWADTSWSQHTFANTSTGSQPTLVDTSAGGKAVQFDGVSNVLETVGAAKLPLGHHGRTVFVVAEYEKETNMGVFGWGANAGVTTAFDTSRFQIGVSQGTGHFAAEFGTGTTSESQCTFEPGIEFQGFTIKSFKSNDKTGSECCSECGVTAGCSHFVHVFSRCWLKSSGKGRIPSPFGASAIVAGTCRKTTHMDSETAVGVDPQSKFVVHTVILANPYLGTQTVRQHVNGKQDGSSTHILTVDTASGSAQLGYDTATNTYAKVKIAEVLVYNTELNKVKQRDVEEHLYSKHLLTKHKHALANGAGEDSSLVRVCATMQELQHRSINCPPGSVIDQIPFASFGNPKGACGDMKVGSCHGLGTRARLSMQCIGRESCGITISDETLGNECPFNEALKELRVEVLCRPIVVISRPVEAAAEIALPEADLAHVGDSQAQILVAEATGAVIPAAAEHNGEAAALDEKCVIEAGVDFYGNDVASFPSATTDECAAFCRADERCLYFTLAWGNCYLKSSDAGRSLIPWVTSGSCKPQKAIREHDCEFEFGTDFYQEGAIGTPSASAVACATECNTNADTCTHFTYAWGLCYLKQSDHGRQTSAKVAQ
eukprot:gene2163-12655_t